MSSIIVSDLKGNVLKVTKGKILDIKIMPDGKIYVKAVDNSGQLVGKQISRLIDKEKEAKNTVDLKTLKNVKIIKAPNTGKNAPALIISNKSAHLVAENGKKGFSVIDNVGSFINGPLTIDAHPESIRIWNAYRINGEVTSTMPSTILTPISLLKLDLPSGSIKAIKEIIDEFKSLIT